MREAWITGTAMMTSAGVGNEAVWDAAMKVRLSVSERSLRTDDEIVRFPCYSIGPVDLKKWFDSSICDKLEMWGLAEDWDFIYLLLSIQLAIQDAGIRTESAARISLIIGHENLGVVNHIDRFIQESDVRHKEEGGKFSQSFSRYQQQFYHLQSFPYLFYLSHIFGFNSFTYAINNACASGLYALELGRQLIASDSTDIVVVACSDYAHITEFLWLDDKGAISREGQIRPFDLNRSGSVLGDGAGALVLESPVHAHKRKASAYCEYSGGSFAQDSWQMTLPDVPRHRYAQVISDAISRYAPSGVDLLIPHGTGSKLWDLYEAKEIRHACRTQRIAVPLMTAFKGYFGHTLGASGMLEMLMLIKAMKEQVIPRALHYETPDPKLGLPILTETQEMSIHTAVKSVPAYGGFHAACVFKMLL